MFFADRHVLQCTMITHQILLRGAAQCYLLQTAMNLVDVVSLSSFLVTVQLIWLFNEGLQERVNVAGPRCNKWKALLEGWPLAGIWECGFQEDSQCLAHGSGSLCLKRLSKQCRLY